MKRKCFTLLIIIVLLLVGLETTKAEDECLYINRSADAKKNDPGLYFNVSLSKLKSQVESGAWTRFDLYSENKKLSTTANIQNWFKSPNSDKWPFVAKDYVEKNDKCPPYVLVTHNVTRYYGFLSDELTCDDENVMEAIKNNVTWNKCWTLTLSSNLPEEKEEENEQQEQQDNSTSCYENSDETSCVNNTSYSCIWVNGDNGNSGYCNTDTLQYVKCGGAFDIPEEVPRIMSFVINLLKIGTPIILIITGVLALVKAIAASKEDEIKKAQSILVKKAIAAAFVFLVIGIVQFVILKAADSSDTGSITTCMSCFLNNDCDTDKYFKTKVGSKYSCHYVSNPSESLPCGEDEN